MYTWIYRLCINSSEILKSKAKKINQKENNRRVSWNASEEFP